MIGKQLTMSQWLMHKHEMLILCGGEYITGLPVITTVLYSIVRVNIKSQSEG